SALDDYFRVVRALHDADALANLKPDEGSSVERHVDSPARIIAAYLARLPTTVLLTIEPGLNTLMLAVIRGGTGSLERRAALTAGSAQLTAAVTELIKQHREQATRIGGGEPLNDSLYEPITDAGRAAWKALPTEIALALDGAATIVYLTSAFGNMSEFPVELLVNNG